MTFFGATSSRAFFVWTGFICGMFVAPLTSFSQSGMSLSLSPTGSHPWSTRQSGIGTLVTWDHIGDAIHLRRIDSTGRLTNDTLAFENTFESIEPRVGTDERYGVVVWQYRDPAIGPNNSYINGYLFRLDSIPNGTYVEFNDNYRDAIRGEPDAAFVNDTTVVVVWGGNGPATIGQSGIYCQIASVSGRKIAGNTLLSDHASPGVNCGSPRIMARRGDGSFIVVWVDNSVGTNRLFGRKFDLKGSGLAPSFLVSDDASMTNMFYYSVATDTSGGFVAVWIADSGRVSRLDWRWFDREGTPTTDGSHLTDYDSLFDSGNSIDVSLQDNGRSVLVWEQRTSKGSRIFGKRMLADRTSIGGSFRISSDSTSSNEILPRVILQNDTMLTVWENDGILASILSFDTITSILLNTERSQLPDQFRLDPCYPNPFNPSTTISFRLESAHRVRLSIYDILGREVVALLDRMALPGTVRTTWDGKDSNGNNLPSGIYFVRLAVGKAFSVQRIALLK